MKLLRSRPNQYPLLLELREVDGMEFPLAKVNEVFDKLEDLRDEEEWLPRIQQNDHQR